jgi:hypothetical protein
MQGEVTFEADNSSCERAEQFKILGKNTNESKFYSGII